MARRYCFNLLACSNRSPIGGECMGHFEPESERTTDPLFTGDRGSPLHTAIAHALAVLNGQKLADASNDALDASRQSHDVVRG